MVVDITEPTLLVDEARCRKNIAMMATKAQHNGVVFKPHFKTAQSHKIGQWYKEAGVSAITVSSLGMAAYFAEDGWGDITVAFPANILQMEIINNLAEMVNLTLLVDNEQTIEALDQGLRAKVNIYIELDSGKGRTGVNISHMNKIDSLVELIKQSSQLNFKGFYLHAGHSYDCRGEAEIKAVYQQSQPALQSLKLKYNEAEICYGDTPTCSIINEFENIDAISPGNFVYYDVMQVQIRSCSINDIALALACPVVAINKEQNQVAVYGGGIHLSKDFIVEEDGTKSYGLIVLFDQESGWGEPLEGCYAKALSQEHGIIKVTKEVIDKVKIGDVLGILPIHSCMTAECIGEYFTLQGEFADHYSQKSRA